MFKIMIVAATAQELSKKILELASLHGTVTRPAWMQENATFGEPPKDFYSESNAPVGTTPENPVQFPVILDTPTPVPNAQFVQPVVQFPPVPGASQVTAHLSVVPSQPESPAADKPVPPAPATPSPSPAIQKAIPEGAELDADGMPWDSRIHAKTKAKKEDGRWRQKRNSDPGYVAQVMSEYKGAGGTGPQAAPVAPFPSSVPSLPPLGQVFADPRLQQPIVPPVMATPPPPTVHVPMPEIAPAPVAQPVQVAASYESISVPSHSTKPVHSFDTFKANFTGVMTELINAKKVDRQYIEELNKYFGIGDIWELPRYEDKLRQCFDGFVQAGFVTAV